jgi:hypothetical protein
MRRSPLTRTRALGSVVLLVLLLAFPGAAVGSEHKEVDEPRLVPASSPNFSPYDCKLKKGGPSAPVRGRSTRGGRSSTTSRAKSRCGSGPSRIATRPGTCRPVPTNGTSVVRA